MKAAIILFVSCVFLGSVSAQERFSIETAKKGLKDKKPPVHHIDPYRLMRNVKKKEYENAECKGKKFDSLQAKIDCKNQARKEFRKDFPDRGTNAYCEKAYLPLSREQAHKARDELIVLLKTVSPVAKFGNERKELTSDHIASELLFIERYILKVEPREYRSF